MKSTEVLAQIGLNVASVEQFVSIACSLADDNPSIRQRVHEAAVEVRSSALLIDHLRNLFTHQHSIEAQQQQQLQLQPHPLQVHHFRHRQAPASSCFERAPTGRVLVDRNALLFTYSNQLTLVRAAKCLVASVAKILYLTDTIVSQSECSPHPHPQHQRQHQHQLQRHQHQVSRLLRVPASGECV